LLPPGTRLAPLPGFTETTLTTGGMTQVVRVDLTNPLTSGVAETAIGRQPTAADEDDVVLLLSWVMGALVKPSRLRLTRRVA